MPVNSSDLLDSTPLDPQKVVLFSADRWKKLTYGNWRTSRSPALVAVDNLIRECDVANREGSLKLGQVRNLKTALEEWKATKTDYRHSRRNRSMCVELLELYISQALSHPEYTYPVAMISENPGREQALDMMTDLRLQFRSVANTFVAIQKKPDDRTEYDKRKNDYLRSVWQETKDKFNLYKDAIKEGHAKAHQLATLIDEKVGALRGRVAQSGTGIQIPDFSAVGALNSIESAVVPPVAVGAMQVVGDQLEDFENLIGKKAVSQFDQAFGDWYQRRVINQARRFVAEGDPQAAVDALEELLSRDMRQELKTGVINTFASAAKVGLTAADLGAAAGASLVTMGIGGPAAIAAAMAVEKALMKGVDKVEKKMIDYFVEGAVAKLVNQEIANGSAILESKNFDKSMFEKCPMFGAYFLLPGGGIPSSALIYWGKPSFGTPAFQGLVEQAMPKVHRLRQTAERAVRKSPIWVKRVGDVVVVPVENTEDMEFGDRLAAEHQANSEARTNISRILANIELAELKSRADRVDGRFVNLRHVERPSSELSAGIKKAYLADQAVETFKGKRVELDHNFWGNTRITKNNLASAGAAHVLGPVLAIDDWKEFSAVGFFKKQKPRFLFARRTKETKKLDHKVEEFSVAYRVFLDRSAGEAKKISNNLRKRFDRGTFDGQSHASRYTRGPNGKLKGDYDLAADRRIIENINIEKADAEEAMAYGQLQIGRRRVLLTELREAIAAWLFVKQDSNSTRTDSVKRLQDLIDAEVSLCEAEARKLGSDHFSPR